MKNFEKFEELKDEFFGYVGRFYNARRRKSRVELFHKAERVYSDIVSLVDYQYPRRWFSHLQGYLERMERIMKKGGE